ncbi:MAG TPA: hypothetical protein VGS13_01420 [Stellaceae bacterium]|nr:hypothetical protein [Stellaceae bacterium]
MMNGMGAVMVVAGILWRLVVAVQVLSVAALIKSLRSDRTR